MKTFSFRVGILLTAFLLICATFAPIPALAADDGFVGDITNKSPCYCDAPIDADGDTYCDICGNSLLPEPEEPTETVTPPKPLPEQGPLVEVMTDLQEQKQLSQVLSQVMNLLPVGLACGIGYLALRKALAILQRILETA